MNFSTCPPRLIIIQSCYFDYRINKPFTCSRCVICVSRSVHSISTYYLCKGPWAFYLNYPQINGVVKFDHAEKTRSATERVTCAFVCLSHHFLFYSTVSFSMGSGISPLKTPNGSFEVWSGLGLVGCASIKRNNKLRFRHLVRWLSHP